MTRRQPIETPAAATKAFGKQFEQEPRVDQAFIKATAAQLDKDVTDSRRNLEKMAIRLVKRSVRTKKIKQDNQMWGNRQMTKNNVVVMPVMIAMLLLFAGSLSAKANDQLSAANATVKIDNFVFGLRAIIVPVGTTATWTNRDDIFHTVVSTDGVFKSKVMDTDEEFSYTLTKPGTYFYYRSVHPKMTGQVVVK